MWETYHSSHHPFYALHEHRHRLKCLISHKSTHVSLYFLSSPCAWAYFSLSTIAKAIFGMTFPAKSSLSKHSTVAMKAIKPATLACTNGSFNDLAKAGTSTLRFVLGPSIGARRPRRMQVLVLIDGSVSV